MVTMGRQSDHKDAATKHLKMAPAMQGPEEHGQSEEASSQGPRMGMTITAGDPIGTGMGTRGMPSDRDLGSQDARRPIS